MYELRTVSILLVTLVGSLGSFVACSRGASEPAAPDSASATAVATAPRPTTPANALPIPSASVAAFVNPEGLPAYAGTVGIVEGTVLVRGPESPDMPGVNVHNCPAAMDTYGKFFRAGRPRADGLKPLADAVVAITGYTGYYLPEPAEAQQVAISANCGYPTRSIALTFGQRLDVMNDSKFTFAPYLDGVFQPAVMIAPPGRNGSAVKLYARELGHFHLLDQLQPFVQEDVYVLRQPLHAVSDLDGHFRIEGVPTTALKVGAGLSGLGEARKDITVRTNVVENVELVLTYDPAKTSPPPRLAAPVIP